MEVTGVAEVTISRGVVVWEHGKLHTTNGHGRFIPRKCFGPPYDGIATRDEVNNPARHKCEVSPPLACADVRQGRADAVHRPGDRDTQVRR